MSNFLYSQDLLRKEGRKWLEIDIVKQILYSYGFESSDEITKKEFKNICETIEKSKQMYGVNVGA